MANLPAPAGDDARGSSSGGGGTIVQLPPAPPPADVVAESATPPTSNRESSSHDAAQKIVSANVARRTAAKEARKRQLLREARAARVEWILGANPEKTSNERTAPAGTHLLGGLRACHSDVLPCAPTIVASLLSSNCEWHRRTGSDASQSRHVRRVLERQGWAWEKVANSASPSPAEEEADNGGEGLEPAAEQNATLDLPQIPSAEQYSSFLHTLCDPSAADVVLSLQKFCKTIEEAATVMVASMAEGEGDGEDGAGGGATEADIQPAGSTPSSASADSVQQEVHVHGATLAKAVKGFVTKTLRQLEEHDAFRGHLHPNDEKTAAGEAKPTIDAEAKEQWQASLEKFVYAKCRHDIDNVLAADTADGAQDALRDKMSALQFVTPAHLEIHCLKDAHCDDVDLSLSIRQLHLLEHQSSPRQMLRSILVAHRGVAAALHAACGAPPGADDVLPALILATLRARPAKVRTALRVIEHFAPLALLRGEAGYAYTNLCGAVQFLRALDVEGHLAEATLGGMGEGAVLHIGPEEFRRGLDACRKRMQEEEEEKRAGFCGESEGEGAEEGQGAVGMDEDDCLESQGPPVDVTISPRQVREAKARGETVDLDWAMRRQNASLWQHGRAKAMPPPGANAPVETSLQRNLPPAEPPLPSHFSRSYAFLTANPNTVGVRDLPRLLDEYRMLVHATERLLEERTSWRESERKRQLRMERETLERDFVDVIGTDLNDGVAVANGH